MALMSELFPNFKVECLTGVPQQLEAGEWGCRLPVGIKGQKNDVVRITSKGGKSWYAALKQNVGLRGDAEMWEVRVLKKNQAKLLLDRKRRERVKRR